MNRGIVSFVNNRALCGWRMCDPEGSERKRWWMIGGGGGGGGSTSVTNLIWIHRRRGTSDAINAVLTSDRSVHRVSNIDNTGVIMITDIIITLAQRRAAFCSIFAPFTMSNRKRIKIGTEFVICTNYNKLWYTNCTHTHARAYTRCVFSFRLTDSHSPSRPPCLIRASAFYTFLIHLSNRFFVFYVNIIRHDVIQYDVIFQNNASQSNKQQSQRTDISN